MSNHGIVGRGVLLDYYGWKLKQGQRYDPMSRHAIQLDELLKVAESQNTSFKVGDILLVRSGYTASYYEYQATAPGRLIEAGSTKPALAGLAQTEEMKTWLYDS